MHSTAWHFGSEILSCSSIRSARTWRADKSEVDITNGQKTGTLVFGTTIGEKLQVAKQFTFNPDSYFVDMTLTFRNVSDEPLLMGGTEPTNGYQISGDGVSMPICSHMKRRAENVGDAAVKAQKRISVRINRDVSSNLNRL